MSENNCFQKVFEKSICGPVKDMKVGFQSVPYNTKKISDSDKLSYYSYVKMPALQARVHHFGPNWNILFIFYFYTHANKKKATSIH